MNIFLVRPSRCWHSRGAAFETARRTLTPSNQSSSVPSETFYSSFITLSNATRLANNLSGMRGAALKLWQMLSI